ncbi:sulfite exporter TauE/SafE family protein, partial [Streptomyces sp. A012304]|uniref:sulfite exporter TauE/SafE family protein n=1 Tax=Streptomyces sp. A012304 TaxID=375446 RepID=UPI00222EB5DC
MGVEEMIAVGLAGVAAGGVNAVVGSGTLISFPVLLAVGLPPVTATVSNALGLVPGSLGAAWGYRAELAGQGRRVRVLAGAAALGGLTGAALLLALPPGAFEVIVPALVGLALVLVACQPLIARWTARRRGSGKEPGAAGPVRPALGVGILLASVYGGYFSAAQGVLYVALMGLGSGGESLQRLNGVKNVLVAVVNGVAAVVFLFVAEFDWTAVALVAAGSAVGGRFGAGV